MEQCDWGHGAAPFRDELLSSWSNRIVSRHKLKPDRPIMPVQVEYRGRRRSWVSASVNPTDEWLSKAARRSGQPAGALASLALSRRYPHLPWYWYSWNTPPIYAGKIPVKNPSLMWSWCSRCLAEDYAAGRCAHIRHEWVVAYSTFCRIHRWPLSSRCQICGSGSWHFSTLPGEPTRMQCSGCNRFLERSEPSAFHDGDNPSAITREIMAVENEIAKALRGKIPDQFRFNFTSPKELVCEFVDFPQLLAKSASSGRYWRRPVEHAYGPVFPDIDYDRYSFDNHYPLAVVNKSYARRFLAVTALLINGINRNAIFGDSPKLGDSAARLFEMMDWDGVAEVKKRKRYWSPDVRLRFTLLLRSFRP